MDTFDALSRSASSDERVVNQTSTSDGLRQSPAVRFFTIHSFDDRPDIRAATMRTLLDHLAAGRISPLIYDRLPLAEAARAHELLESGTVIGKLLLKP